MTRRLDLAALLDDADTSELSDAFLARHLRDVDRDEARAQVLARLNVPALDQGPAVVLSAALAALDPTPVLDRVLDVIADPAVADNGRVGCFQALMALPPAVVASGVARDPRRVAGVEFARVYSVLDAAYEHPEALASLHAMAKGVPARHLSKWATFLETIRQRVDIPASAAYRPLLGDAALAADDGARGVWLDAVVAEADAEGVALLQKLRAGAPKKLRAPFQVALLKLETAVISGVVTGAADKVRVWCSHPDGQGAVASLVAFANPDGTSTLVNLCLRLSRDLRQGFVLPRTQEREVADMLRELTAGSIEVVRAPVGEFATIVDEAVASHKRMGVRVPAECEAPIRALERLPRAPLPDAPAAAAVSPERVREILRGSHHTYWYFDDADLHMYAAGGGGDRAAVLATLGRSPMRERVEAMARFMVHWARWQGDAARSAEWVAIADEVARDFAASALVNAMADASPFATATARKAVTESYGVEGILIPFRELFPAVAEQETKTLRFEGHGSIPDGDYRMEESFCTDRRCNCERVTFHVVGGEAVLCRVGHAFTKAAAKRFYGPQTELDPRGPRPRWADAMAREIDARMRSDAAWRETVVRHYAMARSL